MYLIQNISKKEITISDLNLSFRPKEAKDLDMIFERSKADFSKNLKQAIVIKILKVLQKTESINQTVVKEPVPPIQNGVDKATLEQMKNDIRKEIQDQMSNSNTEVINQLSQIANILKNNQQNKEIKYTENQDQLDKKILSEIHMKNLNKLAKDIKANNVKCDEKKSDKSIDSIVSDLENML